MKYLLPGSVFLLSIIASPFIYGQDDKRTISGIVTSFEESLPLEGVKVSVKGSGTISGTQADGIYYITISPGDSILVFSLPGYEEKEVIVSKSNEYNVSLHTGKNEMPAVVPVKTHYFLRTTYFRC